MLAIDPLHRKDWALENAFVVVFIAVLVGSYKRLFLSRISYTLIFIFLCLHEIGAHYTYAEVPCDRWFQAFAGQTFKPRKSSWTGWSVRLWWCRARRDDAE